MPPGRRLRRLARLRGHVRLPRLGRHVRLRLQVGLPRLGRQVRTGRRVRLTTGRGVADPTGPRLGVAGGVFSAAL